MRPQLLDRFGMCVNVTTMVDSDSRTQMVLDKIAYEQASTFAARLEQQHVNHLLCLVLW